MKTIFRSAMFGFHKGDVFSFITKQNKQYEARIEELNAELEKTKEDFVLERQAFERDTTELETLRENVEKMNQMIATVSSAVSDILNDKSKILACAGTLQNEQAELEAKFTEMQLRINEAEKLRAKAEKFDQLSGVLSSIFNQQQIITQDEPQTANDEVASSNAQTVSELLDLLEGLAVHCEKLQNQLNEDRADA